MTTLILNQKHIFTERFRAAWGDFEVWHAVVYLKRYATPVLLVLAGLSLGLYLGAIYWAFGLGVGIDALKEEREAIERAIAADIVTLQKKHTNLDVEYPAVIGAMERVSQIRYLRPENVAVAVRGDTLLR